jgi:hypothetical protein
VEIHNAIVLNQSVLRIPSVLGIEISFVLGRSWLLGVWRGRVVERLMRKGVQEVIEDSAAALEKCCK